MCSSPRRGVPDSQPGGAADRSVGHRVLGCRGRASRPIPEPSPLRGCAGVDWRRMGRGRSGRLCAHRHRRRRGGGSGAQRRSTRRRSWPTTSGSTMVGRRATTRSTSRRPAATQCMRKQPWRPSSWATSSPTAADAGVDRLPAPRWRAPAGRRLRSLRWSLPSAGARPTWGKILYDCLQSARITAPGDEEGCDDLADTCG